jgi:DNA-binding response OmpR family regulator
MNENETEGVSFVRISPLLVLDREENEIICNGTRVPLTEQQFETLSYLVSKTRWCKLEELFKQTYQGDKRYVTNRFKPIQDAISDIRGRVHTVPGCEDLLVIANKQGYGKYRVCRNDERYIPKANSMKGQKRQPKRSSARSWR